MIPRPPPPGAPGTLTLRCLVSPAMPGDVRVRLVGAERGAEGSREYVIGILNLARRHWNVVRAILIAGAAAEGVAVIVVGGEAE